MKPACAPTGALTYGQRKRLPKTAFAIPSLRKFPLYKRSGGRLIPSRTHAISAKGRAQQAYNRGELSKATLTMIDRKADRVIKECEMAKKKSTKKTAAKRRTPAQRAATARLVAMNKARGKKATKKLAKRSSSAAKVDTRDRGVLEAVDRTVKAGLEVRKGDLTVAEFKRLSALKRAGFVQTSLVRGTYMLTKKGADAIGKKYLTKTALRGKLSRMKPTSGYVYQTETVRKTTRKKTVRKKVSKKRVKKTAKKAAKKAAPRKRRTAAQRAATARLVAANKARARKKTAKKRTAKKKTAKKTAKRRSTARKAPSSKRRTVQARYSTVKGKRGVHVKVSGSKRRVPVEVRDDPKIRNRVLILV